MHVGFWYEDLHLTVSGLLLVWHIGNVYTALPCGYPQPFFQQHRAAQVPLIRPPTIVADDGEVAGVSGGDGQSGGRVGEVSERESEKEVKSSTSSSLSVSSSLITFVINLRFGEDENV